VNHPQVRENGEWMQRIVIITNGNYFARLVLDRAVKDYAQNIVGVMIVTGDYKARSGLRLLWDLGRATTFPYLVYKGLTYVAFDLAQVLRPKATLFVESLVKEMGFTWAKYVSVNSAEACAWVEALHPDLLISVSCPQLIRRKLLSIPTLASLNIHSSLLPMYAGLAPYYWVLSKGEQQTGTTVHYMTRKFDDGNILVQKQITIELRESAFHLFRRLAILGSDALSEAIPLALEHAPGKRQDLSGYSYFSNPSFASYLDLRKHGHRLFRVDEIWQAMWG